jgi:hypothetical protein
MAGRPVAGSRRWHDVSTPPAPRVPKIKYQTFIHRWGERDDGCSVGRHGSWRDKTSEVTTFPWLQQTAVLTWKESLLCWPYETTTLLCHHAHEVPLLLSPYHCFFLLSGIRSRSVVRSLPLATYARHTKELRTTSVYTPPYYYYNVFFFKT